MSSKEKGFHPPQLKEFVPMPKKVKIEDDDKSLETLARECRERGNRLEVMNGKAYEVTRKFIRNVE